VRVHIQCVLVQVSRFTHLIGLGGKYVTIRRRDGASSLGRSANESGLFATDKISGCVGIANFRQACYGQIKFAHVAGKSN
jgi:hypothetical protein